MLLILGAFTLTPTKLYMPWPGSKNPETGHFKANLWTITFDRACLRWLFYQIIILQLKVSLSSICKKVSHTLIEFSLFQEYPKQTNIKSNTNEHTPMA